LKTREELTDKRPLDDQFSFVAPNYCHSLEVKKERTVLDIL